MQRSARKPVGSWRGLLILVPGPLVPLLFLSSSAYYLLRTFSVTSLSLWLVALLFVSASVAWTQGVRVGALLEVRPEVGGLLSTLVLNLLVALYVLDLSASALTRLLAFFSICGLSYAVGTTACRLGAAPERANQGGRQVLLILSSMWFLLIPILLLCLLMLILAGRYGLGLSV